MASKTLQGLVSPPRMSSLLRATLLEHPAMRPLRTGVTPRDRDPTGAIEPSAPEEVVRASIFRSPRRLARPVAAPCKTNATPRRQRACPAGPQTGTSLTPGCLVAAHVPVPEPRAPDARPSRNLAEAAAEDCSSPAAAVRRSLPSPRTFQDSIAAVPVFDKPVAESLDVDWRDLVEVFEQQELAPAVREVLDEFKHHAESEELVLDQGLSNTRASKEALCQRNAMKLKPSRELLNLRKIEKTLANKKAYTQASKVRDEADRMEGREREQLALELQRRLAVLDAALRQSEDAAARSLRKQLYEEIWCLAYDEKLPLSTLQEICRAGA